MAKIEDITQKLEKSYLNLQLLMDDIGNLEKLFRDIEKVTLEFKEKFVEVLDPKRFDDIKNENEKSMKHIMSTIKNIDDNLSRVLVYKDQTQGIIDLFSEKIGSFEKTFNKTKDTANDVNLKLTKILSAAEKISFNGHDKLMKASKLLEVSAEIEKYDELLKIEKDNNRMLKELINFKNKNNENLKINLMSKNEIKPKKITKNKWQ